MPFNSNSNFIDISDGYFPISTGLNPSNVSSVMCILFADKYRPALLVHNESIFTINSFPISSVL